MPDAEVPATDRAQSLVLSGPQSLRQPFETLDVSAEEVPHLLDYWQLILKRPWTVLATLLIVFTTVAIGTLKQKPIYEGKVLLEINPEEPSVLTFSQVVAAESRDLDSYRETQYKVLESRTLAERVVQDLALYRYPEFYQIHLLGLIDVNPDSIPSPSDPRPADPSGDACLNSVKNFSKRLDISPVRRSNLVEVTFESFDAKLAAAIANKLADDYIYENLEVKWDEANKASEWLSKQLVGLKARVEKSEQSLQEYAQANSIVFVTERQNLVNTRLSELQTEYTRAQADRYQKQSLYGLVQSGKTQDLPGVLSNGLVQNLATRLAEAERDYAQLTATVKPEYPKAIALKKQIDTLQASLDHQKKVLGQNIVEEYQVSVAREKYLAQAVEDQKREVNDIASKTIQYNILKREVDTNKSLYDGLLQRMKEAQVSAGVTASNIRVVDAAEVPRGPKSRILLSLTLALIVGTALGVGLAFFQEYLDNTLKTPEEVESLLRLPSLGLVQSFPLNGGGKSKQGKLPAVVPGEQVSIAPAIQTNSAAVEAFRSLRTSILLSANPVPKSLLITSALPGEGKTTTTVNLGATLASLGSRVVIVDCDMRRPACHRATGVENKPGFVQCLTGRVELAQAILPVPGVKNLWVIPCGPIPPNPAEVLSSPAASDLLRRLRSEFDYVVVDSPPLLSVADSRILSMLTDAVVLVVRGYATPYPVVRRARALLYGAGVRILGVALNDVDIGKSGYGYGYGYREGYGQDTNANSAGQANLNRENQAL
ncbi:MAG: polysaccharide biosynthesis tyrosine autokinase [Terriglobia bacterium]|jgi:capsular exopolysaccharide synthesis family protein